jgi:hypothetical protein
VQYITASREVEARLPIPYPFGSGQAAADFTRYFALADFETRNLVKKSRGTIKMVMTEECLDDWEAQTLNIPYEKLVRHKKTQRNVSTHNHSLFLSMVVGGDREDEESGEAAHTRAAHRRQGQATWIEAEEPQKCQKTSIC